MAQYLCQHFPKPGRNVFTLLCRTPLPKYLSSHPLEKVGNGRRWFGCHCYIYQSVAGGVEIREGIFQILPLPCLTRFPYENWISSVHPSIHPFFFPLSADLSIFAFEARIRLQEEEKGRGNRGIPLLCGASGAGRRPCFGIIHLLLYIISRQLLFLEDILMPKSIANSYWHWVSMHQSHALAALLPIHCAFLRSLSEGNVHHWRTRFAYFYNTQRAKRLCKNIPAKFRESPSKCSAANPKIAQWHTISASHSRNLAMFLHYSVDGDSRRNSRLERLLT